LEPLTEGKQTVTPLLFNSHKLEADTIVSFTARHDNIITKANLKEDKNFILYIQNIQIGAPSFVIILKFEI
jgi:hypothetical protein